jgi:integrase
MEHAAPLPAGTAPSPTAIALDDLLGRAADYARQTSAPSTRREYARDWAAFTGWCAAMGLDPLPADPAVVGTYLASLAGRLAVATLTRRLAAISTAHRLAGHRLDGGHPAIRDLMRGVRREHGTRQRRVAPATTSVVQAMAASCGTSLLDLRDRALLLLGFAAALRRSELVALAVNDIAFVAEGARVTVTRSKTDQEGAGEVIGVVRTGTPTCPVTALQAWLEAAGITEGPVFRAVNRHGRPSPALSAQAVALIVKRRATAIGLDATVFAGHSLRAGLATAAAANEVEERVIQRQTRHRSLTVLRSYIRAGEVFVGNASGRVGL